MSRSLKTLVLASVATVVFSPSANALQFHFDLFRDPSLMECDAHRYAGVVDEATQCYEALTTSDIGLVRAEAEAALGNVRDANRLYREASELSDDPAIKTGWGNLFLGTHQIADAIALYREALIVRSAISPCAIGFSASADRYV